MDARLFKAQQSAASAEDQAERNCEASWISQSTFECDGLRKNQSVAPSCEQARKTFVCSLPRDATPRTRGPRSLRVEMPFTRARLPRLRPAHLQAADQQGRYLPGLRAEVPPQQALPARASLVQRAPARRRWPARRRRLAAAGTTRASGSQGAVHSRAALPEEQHGLQ